MVLNIPPPPFNFKKKALLPMRADNVCCFGKLAAGEGRAQTPGVAVKKQLRSSPLAGAGAFKKGGRQPPEKTGTDDRK